MSVFPRSGSEGLPTGLSTRHRSSPVGVCDLIASGVATTNAPERTTESESRGSPETLQAAAPSVGSRTTTPYPGSPQWAVSSWSAPVPSGRTDRPRTSRASLVPSARSTQPSRAGPSGMSLGVTLPKYTRPPATVGRWGLTPSGNDPSAITPSVVPQRRYAPRSTSNTRPSCGPTGVARLASNGTATDHSSLPVAGSRPCSRLGRSSLVGAGVVAPVSVAVPSPRVVSVVGRSVKVIARSVVQDTRRSPDSVCHSRSPL